MLKRRNQVTRKLAELRKSTTKMISEIKWAVSSVLANRWLRLVCVFIALLVIGIIIQLLPIRMWYKVVLVETVTAAALGAYRPCLRPGKIGARFSRKIESILGVLATIIAYLSYLWTGADDVVVKTTLGILGIFVLTGGTLITVYQLAEKIRIEQLRRQLPKKVWRVQTTEIREALEASLHS